MKNAVVKHALVPIAAGLGAIAVVIYVEHKYLPEPALGQSIVYSLLPYSTKFLDHLAIAFLSLGVITMLLELTHLKAYFYGLFVAALTEDKYIQERIKDRDWLKEIQTKVLTGLFGADIKKEGSFFYDYYEQLQSFVGAPYKDQYVGTTTLEYVEGQSTNQFSVDEVVSYTCCKMGEHIASEIGWTANQDELISMPSLEIAIRLPGSSTPKIITTDPEQLKPNPQWGHTMSLAEYKGMGGLGVGMKVKYVVATDRAFSAKMALITKDLTWTINYPPDLTIYVDRFVLADDLVQLDTSTPGKCTFRYPHWVLPGDGFAFHFRKTA